MKREGPVVVGVTAGQRKELSVWGFLSYRFAKPSVLRFLQWRILMERKGRGRELGRMVVG